MTHVEVVDSMMEKAAVALQEYKNYTQEQVDQVIKTMCLAFKDHAEELSKQVVEETGLGDYDSKMGKNTGSPDGIWYDLKGKKSVGIIGEEGENIKLVASPKGILCSVAPTTNPNITVLFNASYALKGRNVIIVAPHPRAKESTCNTVRIINEALKEIGAPDNLIQCIQEPSVDCTKYLMSQSDVVIATGGPSMVNSAYSSGKPAFGVGPGNVQTILDKGFDYNEAAGQISTGRSFDNGLVCAGNQSVIYPKEDKEQVVQALKDNHIAYFHEPEDVQAIREGLFPNGKNIAPHLVGQNVHTIAQELGVIVPEDAVAICVEVENHGEEEVLCGEKMCPVLVSIGYDDFEQAVDIAKENLLFQGAGHSAAIHTHDDAKAEYAGLNLPVSRLLVNQPGIFAANPALANDLRPTASLGCGSWGNNSISENLTFEHLMNISRIAKVKDGADIPDPASIWED